MWEGKGGRGDRKEGMEYMGREAPETDINRNEKEKKRKRKGETKMGFRT